MPQHTFLHILHQRSRRNLQHATLATPTSLPFDTQPLPLPVRYQNRLGFPF